MSTMAHSTGQKVTCPDRDLQSASTVVVLSRPTIVFPKMGLVALRPSEAATQGADHQAISISIFNPRE